MAQFVASCIRCVGGEKICSYCNGNLIKNGLGAADVELLKIRRQAYLNLLKK